MQVNTEAELCRFRDVCCSFDESSRRSRTRRRCLSELEDLSHSSIGTVAQLEVGANSRAEP